jgi:hypothetical protein
MASCGCRCRCGDEVLEINGSPVHCLTLNEVYAILSHCSPGPVPIIVSRHPDAQVTSIPLGCSRLSPSGPRTGANESAGSVPDSQEPVPASVPASSAADVRTLADRHQKLRASLSKRSGKEDRDQGPSGSAQEIQS